MEVIGRNIEAMAEAAHDRRRRTSPTLTASGPSWPRRSSRWLETASGPTTCSPRTCSSTCPCRTGGCRPGTPTRLSGFARTSTPSRSGPGRGPRPHVPRLPAPVRGALGGRRPAVVLPRADPLRRRRRPDQRAGRVLHRRLGRGGPAAARRAGAPAPALTVASRRWRRDRRPRRACWPVPRRPGQGVTARPRWRSSAGPRTLAEAERRPRDPGRSGPRSGPRPAVQPDPGPAAGPAARGVRGGDEPGPAGPAGGSAGPLLGLRERAAPGPTVRDRGARPRRALDDPVLLADALDAALASHWGPDELALRRDWAVRLDDAAAHLRDPDARLQAQLWGLTVAWEVLDLPRMHRCMRAIELLAEESPRAAFFAASRRLPLELLRRHLDVAPLLVGAGRGGRRGGGDPGRGRRAAQHARLHGVLRRRRRMAARPRHRRSRRSRSSTGSRPCGPRPR